MVGFEDAFAPSLLLLFYAYDYMRPGRFVQKAPHNKIYPKNWTEVEMQLCILCRSLLGQAFCLYAGSTAKQQTFIMKP